MTSAIIVAAGSSRRMGFDKLGAELGGLPVLTRSLLAFQACGAIDRIVVVTAPERWDAVTRLREAGTIPKLHRVVPGASERHLSVHCGLMALPPGTDYVAVHDGARPLVTPAAISRCLEGARAHRAASLAHRVTDTLKRADEAGLVTESVSRERLWAMETPQAFERSLLLRAYERILASGDPVTDEVSAVQALGEAVRLVENPDPNPKITFPADLPVAEAILAARG